LGVLDWTWWASSYSSPILPCYELVHLLHYYGEQNWRILIILCSRCVTHRFDDAIILDSAATRSAWRLALNNRFSNK
jgi:hypothetical protein